MIWILWNCISLLCTWDMCNAKNLDSSLVYSFGHVLSRPEDLFSQVWNSFCSFYLQVMLEIYIPPPRLRVSCGLCLTVSKITRPERILMKVSGKVENGPRNRWFQRDFWSLSFQKWKPRVFEYEAMYYINLVALYYYCLYILYYGLVPICGEMSCLAEVCALWELFCTSNFFSSTLLHFGPGKNFRVINHRGWFVWHCWALSLLLTVVKTGMNWLTDS